MQWSDLVGHQQQREWFANALQQNRLGSTFLFVGPDAIGKRTFALLLAKTLLCEQNPPADLAPCGQCDGCVQVEADTHPDLLQVSKPADRAFIPLESLIGPRESRMQEGLCHDVHLRPHMGRYRLAIIDDADYLNEEGANCLLKTLEEPPPAAKLFLIGSNLQRQLPTIRSRCQIVRFIPPVGDAALRLLAIHNPDAAEEDLQRAQHSIGGRLDNVARLPDPDEQAFYEELTHLLDAPVLEATRIASTVSGFVETAGTDAPKRRQRLREVFRAAIESFRTHLRDNARVGGDVQHAEARLMCTLDALAAVDRNANQATLIESWSFDLQSG